MAKNDNFPNSYGTSFTWISTFSLSLSFLSCSTISRNFGVRRMNAFTMWPRSWTKIRLVYKLVQENEASKIGWGQFLDWLGVEQFVCNSTMAPKDRIFSKKWINRDLHQYKSNLCTVLHLVSTLMKDFFWFFFYWGLFLF